MSKTLLEVRDLVYSFDTYAGEVQAVRGVSFRVEAGETLAIVGESGCGKSVSVQAVMGLVPSPPGRLKSGSIQYLDREISTCSDAELSKLRGSEMSMIFQDPMTCLNPTMRIGRQITEGIMRHEHLSNEAARVRAVEMLKKVGIHGAEKSIRRYPHELSGGMRQRVMIAMALSCRPKILFADEPTTALDVTTQAQILDLMNQLKQEMGASVVLITHDLGVVARMAQRIAVMYAGKIVETGSARDVFYNPKHPYTWGLLSSMPRLGAQGSKELQAIPGTPPDLFAPPKGCAFAARCAHCMNVCEQMPPPETEVSDGHQVSCWLSDERAPKVGAEVLNRGRE